MERWLHPVLKVDKLAKRFVSVYLQVMYYLNVCRNTATFFFLFRTNQFLFANADGQIVWPITVVLGIAEL